MNQLQIQSLYFAGALDAFEIFYRMNIPYNQIEKALGEEIEHEFAVWVYNQKEAA